MSDLSSYKSSSVQQLKGSIKFANPQKNTFFSTLKKRVDEYFKSEKISPYGNSGLAIKTIVLFSMYILPLAVMIIWAPGFLVSVLLWTTMGLGMAGLGMSVMHDANHGAYSSNKALNWVMAHTLNVMGGSTMNWKLQHNILHHTYTNITHMDDDIAPKPALRLSPHNTVSKSHEFQWIHAFLLYGLTTLYWVTAKDFVQYIQYRRNKVNPASPAESRIILLKLIANKLLYYVVFIGLPIFLFHLPVLTVVTGFLLMHFIAGLILTVVFQLAHSLEGTSHPLPSETGIIQNDWAIHQMNTTMNFSPHNKLLSWYVGGLNFQVEHHLFPRISHIHYPRIASIVKSTAAEFQIPYLEHDTFQKALRAHIFFLKKLGKMPDLNEAIG
jgi:linoleoyl-CoA desaturase